MSRREISAMTDKSVLVVRVVTWALWAKAATVAAARVMVEVA
jgi:hypothetical protein